MIATAEGYSAAKPFVPQRVGLPLHTLQAEAVALVAETFHKDEVSGKAIRRAGVPGVSLYRISRAANGVEANPLALLVGWFVLMKRLGMGRERALRIVDWLREVVDMVWPPEQVPPLRAVMEKETELDTEEDRHQMRAVFGCPDALRRFYAAKQEEAAYLPTVLLTVRAHLARMDAR